MISYSERIDKFQSTIAGKVDLVYLPICTDLQYLTGVPRDIPNFGVTIHPGAWLEGAWMTPDQQPILLLSRMSAELSALGQISNIQLRVLGEWDDPSTLVREILK